MNDGSVRLDHAMKCGSVGLDHVMGHGSVRLDHVFARIDVDILDSGNDVRLSVSGHSVVVDIYTLIIIRVLILLKSLKGLLNLLLNTILFTSFYNAFSYCLISLEGR